MDTAEQLNIPIPRTNANERHLCPQCSGDRKNKTDKCLSVKVEDDVVVFYCHHCGYSGNALINGGGRGGPDFERLTRGAKKIAQEKSRKSDVRPSSNMGNDQEKTTKKNVISFDSKAIDSQRLSKKSIAFLESRKVSKDVALSLGVKSMNAWTQKAGRETDCIAFPYTNNGKVYAAKVRSTEVKAFTCKGSPQTLFNVERLKDKTQVVITEGEMDVLAMAEAGIEAVSIPHGAVQPASTNNDKRFAFIGNASDILEAADKVIIAVDGDGPGIETAEELARRVGKAKCYQVMWPDGCKDANDVLIKHDKATLSDVVAKATPWPVDGLYGADHYTDEVESLYINGLPPAASTGLAEVDKIYRVGKGQLTVVTGHPNHGKSEFINQIMINMAVASGMKFAICSFENPPPIHIANLTGKIIKRPFFGGDQVRMTRLEMERALDLVNRHFVFLGSGSGDLSTIDGIIDRLKSAVLRYGINGAVIDPYNYIARSNDKSETDTISDMLTKIKAFCMAYDVHVWFVAHPTKMTRNADGDVPPPKGYDISGSAAWSAKADMGITIHRPDKTYSNKTEIHVWKVRFSWHGKDGVAEIYYQPHTTTYIDPP